MAQTDEIEIVGRIANLRDRSVSNGRLFSHLRFSATANIIWLVRELSLDRQSAALDMQLDALSQAAMRGASFAQSGPALPKGADLMDTSIDIWTASSTQLQRLASGNGFAYYHFLQPNQYVSGSKEFPEREKEKALNHKEKWDAPVNLGYAKLRDREIALRSAGVDFADLSRVFRGVKETVYIDSCCHLNELGADLLARAIVRHISGSRGS